MVSVLINWQLQINICMLCCIPNLYLLYNDSNKYNNSTIVKPIQLN